MKKKILKKCCDCGKRKEDVRKRACGFYEEIHGEEKMETICDDCEHEHLMHI